MVCSDLVVIYGKTNASLHARAPRSCSTRLLLVQKCFWCHTEYTHFFTVSFSYFEVRFFRHTIRTIKIAHILYSYRYIISHTTHKQCQNENVRGLKSWSFTFDSSQQQECSRLSRCLNINLHLVCCYAFQPNRRVFGLFSYLFKHFFFGWE